MVNNRGSQATLIATELAARHIGYAAQQALLGAWIGGHIEKLLDVGSNGLSALRAGDLSLRHEVIPIYDL
jgi:hypothetical protein